MINLLITSPKDYAKRLLKALEKRKVRVQFLPFCRPMIQTDIAIDHPVFEDFVHHLEDYDYVAFSSRKAIEALAQGLSRAHLTLPKDLKLCAIGKDNELIGKGLRVRPAFMAEEASPQGIVDYLAKLPEAKGKRIAVLAPEVVGLEEPAVILDFLAGLRNIGMEPVRIKVYQTKGASDEILARTSRDILAREFNAVVFTSGTEIEAFLRMVPEDMSLEQFLKRLVVICYGPYTARCAEKNGIEVDHVCSSFSCFEDLVEELQMFYESRS